MFWTRRCRMERSCRNGNRSRRGKFLGFSKEHATNVGLILNLRTGSVSPQYHVAYDELFQTVTNTADNNPPLDEILWDHLVTNKREVYFDDDVDPTDIPPLHTDWLDPDELDDRKEQEAKRFAREYGRRQGQLDSRQPLPVQDQAREADFEDDDPVALQGVAPAAPAVAPPPLRRSARGRVPNRRYDQD